MRGCWIWLFFFVSSVFAQTFERTGFTVNELANGLNRPVVMAHAPDGRIFIGEQGGTVKIYKNGAVLPTPFVHVDVWNDGTVGERGLVGIALHPNFAQNGWVYLYYTIPSAANNRIVRFTANGDVASGGPTLILDLDPLSSATNHNGGAMNFGTDGKLYVAVGDNAYTLHSQDLTTYHGKILRLEEDGTPVQGNPFYSQQEVQAKSIFAYGFRNPFSFTIHPTSGKIFVNDVGGVREEINDVLPGLNYGWPTSQGGPSSNPDLEDPVFSYERIGSAGTRDQGCAIVGGTFYYSDNPAFPSDYLGDYFFFDWCSTWINRLHFDGATVTKETFAESVGGTMLGLSVGASGNLYYLDWARGRLHSIIYTSQEPPRILIQPQSRSVPSGQPVTFSVSAAGAQPISYQWQKGGSDIQGATGNQFTINSLVPSDAGDYRVRISNNFGSLFSDSVTLTVTSFNEPPQVTITSPAPGSKYRAGEIATFSASAIDNEDGVLPDSAFSWDIVFHHDDHIHPGFQFNGIRSGTFLPAAMGHPEYTVWYRVSVTVTDSTDLESTTFVDLLPHLSSITVDVNVPGLQITMDGTPFPAPFETLSVQGVARTIGTITPQEIDGKWYEFDSWSTGGDMIQDVLTEQTNVTYIANFYEVTTAIDEIFPTDDAFARGGSFSDTSMEAIDSTLLETKNADGNMEFTRSAYLKFDISKFSAEQIISATFRAHLRTNVILPVSIYTTETEWSESSITWNTRPNSIRRLATETAVGPGTVTWDLTNFITQSLRDGNSVISLGMENDEATGPQLQWNSTESDSFFPSLLIENANITKTSPPTDGPTNDPEDPPIEEEEGDSSASKLGFFWTSFCLFSFLLFSFRPQTLLYFQVFMIPAINYKLPS